MRADPVITYLIYVYRSQFFVALCFVFVGATVIQNEVFLHEQKSPFGKQKRMKTCQKHVKLLLISVCSSAVLSRCIRPLLVNSFSLFFGSSKLMIVCCLY